MRLLAEEIVKDHPGQEAGLDRLLELVLIAVLRPSFARPDAEVPWPAGTSLHGQRGDPADLLIQLGPALAAVLAVEQRAVAQTGEELALSGRERVDVGVERARRSPARGRSAPSGRSPSRTGRSRAPRTGRGPPRRTSGPDRPRRRPAPRRSGGLARRPPCPSCGRRRGSRRRRRRPPRRRVPERSDATPGNARRGPPRADDR